MLFSSSTNANSGMSQVASATFSDVSGIVILILGIILGIYILERLIVSIFPHRYIDDKNNV